MKTETPVEAGFYKLDNDDLLFAPNFVYNKNYELHISQKDNYQYPVDGWYYFDTLLEAQQYFQIYIPD